MARLKMSKFLKRIEVTLSMRALFVAAVFVAFAVPVLAQQKPTAPASKQGIGRAAHADELKAWSISILPDGRGLPVGKGTAKKGEELFVEKCAACHGEFGEGVGRWPVLAGGTGSLKNDRPEKTVGSFWPSSTTLFDYLRRAMPYGNAQSLESDELYALSAYILHMSDVIKDPAFEVNEKNFALIKMPNGGGFYDDDREIAEKHFWKKSVCMTNCKPEAPKVTGRAMVLDVTPDSKTAPRVE
jgi:S-disulfanyl-L-cysteine oxidoreductase SoxD